MQVHPHHPLLVTLHNRQRIPRSLLPRQAVGLLVAHRHTRTRLPHYLHVTDLDFQPWSNAGPPLEQLPHLLVINNRARRGDHTEVVGKHRHQLAAKRLGLRSGPGEYRMDQIMYIVDAAYSPFTQGHIQGSKPMPRRMTLVTVCTAFSNALSDNASPPLSNST